MRLTLKEVHDLMNDARRDTHAGILALLKGHQPPDNAVGSYADGFLDAVKKVRARHPLEAIE